MTITFENDNDVIVYALEKVISHAKRTQQIFVAQCVWWIASIIGLEQRLVTYIDNIQSRVNVTIAPERILGSRKTISPIPRDNQEDQRRDQVLKKGEEFLQEAKRLRRIEKLKSSGIRRSSRAESYKVTKTGRKRQEGHSDIQGIEEEEIRRRRLVGECLRCAWPSDRKGSHRYKDCRRPIKLDKGTAIHLKEKGR
jgi:hypothetical protein